MLDNLTTEARNPASTHLDELTPLELVRLMNREDRGVADAVGTQAEAIARAIEVVADRLGAGGRLVYAGAGTSGRLGVLDATECPPTFNVPPGLVIGIIAGGPPALVQAVEGAEDNPELAERDLASLNFSAKDVLVGIATSGRTPYVLGAAEYARRLGAFAIGLACNLNSELEPHVDLMITPVVGPEVLSGSTRLKAGTATKLVLNMLTTGAMVRLGKTYGNLMVDLRATNTKLRARTNRIVRTLTGLDADAADALLRDCGGELKTALVAYEAKVTPTEARALLQQAGGRVGQALKAHRPRSVGLVATEVVIGIDGGGTHTVALLATPSGEVLGRGEAGPSNLQAVGITKAFQSLEDAIAGAFASAKRERSPVAAVCFGLAGADREQDKKLIRQWAGQTGLAARVEVTGDAQILLQAGTPEGWGVAIIAGTGSIAIGRAADGRFARAGGWGYLLGDEGSGYALVMDALKAVARAADGVEPPTSLSERLLSAMDLKQPIDLIAAVYRGGWDRTALSALAPHVLAAAEAGDATAARIVAAESVELARDAVRVVEALGLDKNAVPVALTGGTLLGSDAYRGQLLTALAERGIRAEPVTLMREPALGAVRLAAAACRT